MDKITQYFRDTAVELKQVSWPTQQQALLYTALVIVISTLVAFFTGGFDYLFSQGVGSLVENQSGALETDLFGNPDINISPEDQAAAVVPETADVVTSPETESASE